MGLARVVLFILRHDNPIKPESVQKYLETKFGDSGILAPPWGLKIQALSLKSDTVKRKF
jgi:hypothetical protein